MFNKFAQFPNRAGLVLVRNHLHQLGWVHSTDNIRARVKATETQHLSKAYAESDWGAGRQQFAEESHILMFDYIETGSMTKEERKSLADKLCRVSVSEA